MTPSKKRVLRAMDTDIETPEKKRAPGTAQAFTSVEVVKDHKSLCSWCTANREPCPSLAEESLQGGYLFFVLTIPCSAAVPPAAAAPPGAVAPGAVPPGAVPPGAVPPGAVPPDAVPPGAVPPAAVVPPAAAVPPARRSSLLSLLQIQ